MRVLCLAPHPFYADRGTPIAVRVMVETIARLGHGVDLLTYHEGQDIEIPGVRQFRITRHAGVHNVPVGPSWQKLYCDILFAKKFLDLVRRHRYALIHAVEESAMMAFLLRPLHALPYVVDMDSSIPSQIGERMGWTRPFLGLARMLERWTVRGATATVAVCEAVAEIARTADPAGPVAVVQDVALLDEFPEPSDIGSHRETFGIPSDTPLVLYVGNLAPYQGVDLLLEAFARVREHGALVIVGGTPPQIEAYNDKALRLGIGDKVHWVGARPIAELSGHLRQADVLVSPRYTGVNTPMKIYSYMASGVPVVATEILSHTQVQDDTVAVLRPPTPEAFADGLDLLLGDAGLRARLGAAARDRAYREYSREAFERKLARLYRDLEEQIRPGGGSARARAAEPGRAVGSNGGAARPDDGRSP